MEPARNPTKACKECRQEKPLSCFHFDRGYPVSICRVCVGIKGKRQREANPEAVREKSRRYYDRHRDEIIRKVAEWGKVNQEKVQANRRRWDERNLEKNKERKRRWRLENAEKMAAARADWKARHPDYGRIWASQNLDKVNAYSNARRAKYVGRYTDADVDALWKAQKARCANCQQNLSDGYHVDHIHPITLGGTNWPDNLQLLCPSCNQRKGGKHPVDWARENGRLF